MDIRPFLRLQIAFSTTISLVFLAGMIDRIGAAQLFWAILAGCALAASITWSGYAVLELRRIANLPREQVDHEGRLAELLAMLDGETVRFVYDPEVEARYRHDAALMLPLLQLRMRGETCDDLLGLNA